MAGLDAPLLGVDLAGLRGAPKGHRVTLHQTAAQLHEAPGIGAGHRERIGNARHPFPEHRVAEHRRKRGLERARPVEVENVMDDAVLLGDLALERGRGESGFGAVELEPAGVAQILLGAALGHQRLVLGERAGV